MSAITTLGPALTSTQATTYHSRLLDPLTARINEDGVLYCSAAADVADGIQTQCPSRPPGCYPAPPPQ